jgi:EamA domain-containing membrane protein RarD
MYPLVTVGLARLVLGERLLPMQMMGVLLATGGVSLIALG